MGSSTHAIRLIVNTKQHSATDARKERGLGGEGGGWVGQVSEGHTL